MVNPANGYFVLRDEFAQMCLPNWVLSEKTGELLASSEKACKQFRFEGELLNFIEQEHKKEMASQCQILTKSSGRYPMRFVLQLLKENLDAATHLGP